MLLLIRNAVHILAYLVHATCNGRKIMDMWSNNLQ